MTQGGPLATRRRRVMTRLFAVHMLSYAVAFPWAIAAIPAVFAWEEQHLVTLGSEHDAVVYVLKLAAWPTLAAFLVPHLLGVPWALAPEGSRRGSILLAGGCSLLVSIALGGAIFGWAHVVRR